MVLRPIITSPHGQRCDGRGYGSAPVLGGVLNLPAPGRMDITAYARIVAIELLDANNQASLQHVRK